MLKRPKFFNFLVIFYLISAIIGLFQLLASQHTSLDPNSYESMQHFSSSYFSYFWGMIIFALSVAMLYNLLALRFHGWLLQLSFSFYYIYNSFYLLTTTSENTFILPFEGFPKFIIIIFMFFNAYIIYYFFTPEIRNLFFNIKLKKEIKTAESLDFLYTTEEIILERKSKKPDHNIQNNNMYIVQNLKKKKKKEKPTNNVIYIPTAKILIADNYNIKQKQRINELNNKIDRRTRDVIRFLTSILLELKDQDVIDLNTYKYYQNFSWNADEIIEEFKMRAIEHCEDKRNAWDKFLKYSKKVEELDLLEKTYEMMTAWIDDAGSEVGDLIHINS